MSSVPPMSIRQGADASIGFFSRMRWSLFDIEKIIYHESTKNEKHEN
jgi:hypothetical protein